MSAHTPGPWKLDTYGNVKVGHDYVKFSGLCLSSGRVANANTHLIAAAPDFYAAAILFKKYEAASEVGNGVEAMLLYAEVTAAFSAAIAKATGEES